MAEQFDRKKLAHLEQSAKVMAESRYGQCIFMCNQDATNMASCKQSCYQNVLVPYKIIAHQAASEEENLFKKCLASKFPNLQPETYAECTKDIYA